MNELKPPVVELGITSASIKDVGLETLHSELGISFSTQKDLQSKTQINSPDNIEAQIRVLEYNGITKAQLCLRTEETEKLIWVIQKVRKEHPNIEISFHTKTPSIKDRNIQNRKQLQLDIEMVIQSGGGILSIHPGAKTQTEFNEFNLLPILAQYFAQLIVMSNPRKLTHPPIVLAIENLPTKQAEGCWGQTIHEISQLIKETRKIVICEYGYDSKLAEISVGMTLDVSHALSGLTDHYHEEQIIRDWMEYFRYDIRCIHIFAPKEINKKFVRRFKFVTSIYSELVNKFGISFPLYLESKQDLNTTEKSFQAARKLLVNVIDGANP